MFPIYSALSSLASQDPKTSTTPAPAGTATPDPKPTSDGTTKSGAPTAGEQPTDSFEKAEPRDTAGATLRAFARAGAAAAGATATAAGSAATGTGSATTGTGSAATGTAAGNGSAATGTAAGTGSAATGTAAGTGSATTGTAAGTGSTATGTAAGAGSTPTGTPPPQTFSQVVRSNFSRLDADEDGYLSGSEINRAMKDKAVTGDLAAAVATLKQFDGDLEELSNDEVGDENDGVTPDDLDDYDSELASGDGDAKSIEATFNGAKSKIGNASRALFANGSPDYKEVRQGRLGDCWYISAAASKAAMDPDGLKRMIADNADGTYTVSLGEDKVTVNAPTDSEIAYGAGAGKDGTWMSVLEKAQAKREAEEVDMYTSFGGLTGLETYEDRGQHEYDYLDHGAWNSRGIEDLTGNDTNADMLLFTRNATTRDRLEEALLNKKVVTAGIRKEVFGDGKADNGMPMGHAYSVLGYDRKTDMVTVRNPWGHGEPVDDKGRTADGKNDGIFEMSMADFDDNFTQISYEED